MVSLFKLLQKCNKLKLPEVRRPDEVEKTDSQLLFISQDVGASYEELLHLRGCPPSSNRRGCPQTSSRVEDGDD